MSERIGMLVEIVNMTSKVQTEGGEEPVDLNGLKGRVVGWQEDERRFTITTFSGLVVQVADETLEEFEPLDTEDGGFDVVWPQGNSMAEGVFGSMVADCLET